MNLSPRTLLLPCCAGGCGTACSQWMQPTWSQPAQMPQPSCGTFHQGMPSARTAGTTRQRCAVRSMILPLMGGTWTREELRGCRNAATQQLRQKQWLPQPWWMQQAASELPSSRATDLCSTEKGLWAGLYLLFFCALRMCAQQAGY